MTKDRIMVPMTTEGLLAVFGPAWKEGCEQQLGRKISDREFGEIMEMAAEKANGELVALGENFTTAMEDGGTLFNAPGMACVTMDFVIGMIRELLPTMASKIQMVMILDTGEESRIIVPD